MRLNKFYLVNDSIHQLYAYRIAEKFGAVLITPRTGERGMSRADEAGVARRVICLGARPNGRLPSAGTRDDPRKDEKRTARLTVSSKIRSRLSSQLIPRMTRDRITTPPYPRHSNF